MSKANRILTCLVFVIVIGVPGMLIQHRVPKVKENSRLSFLLLSHQSSQVARGCDLKEIDSLLRFESMKLDPDTKRIVELLDSCLDFDPREKEVWVRLGRSLGLGVAKSRHAEYARDAWARAYQLDPKDCHTGALLARSQEGERAKDSVRRLVEDHPLCPEALYLEATVLTLPGKKRVKILRKSLETFNSAEASLALGQECIRMQDFHKAIRQLSHVSDAPALFNEYWGCHGWAITHAQLGLAWAHFKAGHPKEARKYLNKANEAMLAPGPWNDLSQEEEFWLDILKSKLRR